MREEEEYKYGSITFIRRQTQRLREQYRDSIERSYQALAVIQRANVDDVNCACLCLSLFDR